MSTLLILFTGINHWITQYNSYKCVKHFDFSLLYSCLKTIYFFECAIKNYPDQMHFPLPTDYFWHASYQSITQQVVTLICFVTRKTKTIKTLSLIIAYSFIIRCQCALLAPQKPKQRTAPDRLKTNPPKLPNDKWCVALVCICNSCYTPFVLLVACDQVQHHHNAYTFIYISFFGW